jgi:hypothetical protein
MSRPFGACRVRCADPTPTTLTATWSATMRSVPAGSFERLSDPASLWAAWHACRRGKRRGPTIAAFDLDSDRHLLALSRDLRSGRYRPSPWRLRLIVDTETDAGAAAAGGRARRGCVDPEHPFLPRAAVVSVWGLMAVAR